MREGVIIGKSDINDRQCDAYKDKLLQQIKDPDYTQQDVSEYISSLQSILKESDLEQLVKSFLDAFNKLNLPLQSKEDFAAYLKFFEISVHMSVLFPQYSSILDSIINQFLISLSAINSEEWHLIILNQIPLYILKKCCTNFTEYEKIKDNKIRNIYFKFYKLIEKNKNNEKIESIKTAMNYS